MPRPVAPPTPGSSSDIRGKEGGVTAPSFALPPSSYQDLDRASTSSSPQSNNGSDSSYQPVSPGGVAGVKRPSVSGGVITSADFALPPPPTRSRKIIQMKPREDELTELAQAQSAAKAGAQQASNGKKKQASGATTAAGRKIARKTAHSLIERRRRSKMNEEFGVLKDMIPACKGQEMHKLAILQASIEYLRYLEQCVHDLQAQGSPTRSQPPAASTAHIEDHDEEDDEDEEMEDEQVAEDESPQPPTALRSNTSGISLPSLSQITSASTTSPSIFSNGAGRHYSISSTSQTSFSPYIHSNQPSPAFGPQLHQFSINPAHHQTFGLGSPALKPIDQLRNIAEGATELSEKRAKHGGRTEHDLDQEATAALLMLNNDRRQWRTVQKEQEERRNGTGMSVRDLLSG